MAHFTSQVSAMGYFSPVRGPIFRPGDSGPECGNFLIQCVSSIPGRVFSPEFCLVHFLIKNFWIFESGASSFLTENAYFESNWIESFRNDWSSSKFILQYFLFSAKLPATGTLFSFRMWIFNFQKFESDPKWTVHKGESA